eukprot:GHVT01081363.1.p1 GENE.GHVT01081363.1~~GHVT01081363.1.p1  ORF type:complete len:144 (-),score=16.16 GHVT01081363.1:280-711(-)
MVRHIHCNDVRLVAHDAQGPNVAEEVHAATEVRLPPLASFRPVAAGESHAADGLTKWTTYRALGHTAGCPVEVLCSFLSLLLSRLFNSALLRRSNSVQIDLLPNGRRSYRIADPWARMRPTCRSCFSFVFPIYSLTREPEHGC